MIFTRLFDKHAACEAGQLTPEIDRPSSGFERLTSVLPSVVILVVTDNVLIAAFAAGAASSCRAEFMLDDAPDEPRSFGSEMSWLAVKTRDTHRLARHLGLTGPAPANWNSGLGAIYDPELSDALRLRFAAHKGWTIVAGVSLPLPAGRRIRRQDDAAPAAPFATDFRACSISRAFPIIDFYAWARWAKGRRVRAFAIGEAGIVWDTGKPTPDERKLGLSFIELGESEAATATSAASSISIRPSITS